MVSNRLAICIRKSHAVAMVACLDFIETSFHHGAMTVDQLRAIVNIVKEYSHVSCQVLQLDSPPRSADERQSAVSLLFAAAALLAGATRVIPASCPCDILQVIVYKHKRECLRILLDMPLSPNLTFLALHIAGNCIYVQNVV